MDALLDVDRWDRAGEREQDLAIAGVAHLIDADFELVRTERFTATQRRLEKKECDSCHGWGGVQPQSGSEWPDCDWCNNRHYFDHPYPSSPLAHRVAVFRHRASATELVLVPGRLDIAACLVARVAHAGEPPPGLRFASKAELRHAFQRAGAFALEWEDGTWPDAHPFGLTGEITDARLACSIPALAAAQADAYHALADEVGVLEPHPAELVGAVRTGSGTADPPVRARVIAFSLDGRWLATASDDITIWETATGRQVSRFALSARAGIESLAFSPDHLRLVAGSAALVEVFEIATGESLLRLGGSQWKHRCATWLPSGRLLVAEARGIAAMTILLALSLVDAETGETVRSTNWTQRDHLFDLSVAATADGARGAVSIRREDKIVILDLERLEVAAQHTFDDRLSHVVFAGDTLIVASRDRLFAASPDDESLTSIGGTGSSDIAASGTRFAAWVSGGISVRDLAAGAPQLLPRARTPVAFSADGTRIATGYDGHSFTVIWPVLPSAAR